VELPLFAPTREHALSELVVPHNGETTVAGLYLITFKGILRSIPLRWVPKPTNKHRPQVASLSATGSSLA